jgi:hypothetical protein
VHARRQLDRLQGIVDAHHEPEVLLVVGCNGPLAAAQAGRFRAT